MGTLFAGGSRAPSTARAPAVTGEVPSPTTKSPEERALVAPAQKPAPEIESEIRSFGGLREPPSVTELSWEQLDDGRFKILKTNSQRKFGDKNHPKAYQPGETVDVMPLPPPAEDVDPTIEVPEKSSKDAAKSPSSH